MTSKNTSAKAAADTTAAETTEPTEASVPQQNTGDKVTVLKGRGGETGDKDAVVISEEEPGKLDKFKSLFRDKKVLAGLGTVAAIAIFAIAKSMMAGSDEEIVDEPVEPDTTEDEASSDTE
ncbi:MAG TPA: hypothetical protein VNA32_08790 [Actinomycetota bacterium]|nr:hypothetical protein [Actinomycetota bacterium]